MDDLTEFWGEKINDYCSYKCDGPRLPDLKSISIPKQVADSVGGIRDLLKLVGSKGLDSRTTADEHMVLLRSFLNLANEPGTIHMLANPNLLRICVGLMSGVKVSGKTVPIRYEYGFLCFELFVVATSVGFVYRMGKGSQLVEDMGSQPRNQGLRVLAQHAAWAAERLAGEGEVNMNQCDWTIGWAGPDYALDPNPGPIIFQEDVGALLEMLWEDRKYYLKALATSYLPGFSAIILLLWRYWELDQSSLSGSRITSAGIPSSALSDLILRYWLVMPPNEEQVLQQISNTAGYQLFGPPTGKAPEFVDNEDCETLVQAYVDRIIPPNPMTDYPSLNMVSVDTAFMYLRFVRWHLDRVTDGLFILAFRSTFAYFYDGILGNIRHGRPDADTMVILSRLSYIMMMFPQTLLPRIKLVPEFLQEVVANELMGLMALIILTEPFYRRWNNELIRSEDLLKSFDVFFKSIKNVIPGESYQAALQDLFPAWMRVRIQLSSQKPKRSRGHFDVCSRFWDRIGELLSDGRETWETQGLETSCGYISDAKKLTGCNLSDKLHITNRVKTRFGDFVTGVNHPIVPGLCFRA